LRFKARIVGVKIQDKLKNLSPRLEAEKPQPGVVSSEKNKRVLRAV
jgi:hypothetical protein